MGILMYYSNVIKMALGRLKLVSYIRHFQEILKLMDYPPKVKKLTSRRGF